MDSPLTCLSSLRASHIYIHTFTSHPSMCADVRDITKEK